ncbi:phage tail spike protein, partial [Streptococcus suis]
MISLKDKNVLLVNAFDDEIEQEGNGKYQLSFKYPTSDQRWKNIELADLLLADDLHGEQEFRVFEIVKRNGYIFVYANQVVDDLNSYSISNISVDRVNGQTVMQALAGSIIRKHPFAFYSDIQDRHVFNQKNISVMGALANGKHSIIGQWGGDLVRDKYNVNLLKRGGRESEALFMYKKNLKSYAETNSIKGLFTRLNLSVKNSDIKTTVDSPLIGSYGGRVYELNVEVADQYVATLEQLQEYGRNYFAEKLIDVPNNSLTISVTDSQEYDVRIFDTVFVHHEIFDKDLRMKITSYRFSPMGRKLKSIGFGKIKTSLTQQVSNIATEVVEQSVSVAGQVFEEKLQKEIENADKVIDGKINKVRDEINDGIEQSRAEAERHADNIKRSIDTEIAQVNQSMQAQSEEHDRQVADILSKAQSVESLANQAKADAASALARANQVKTEAIADARAQVSTVSQALNTAKTDLQNQVDAVDAKAVKVQSDATALRIDLDLQAGKILEQAQTLNTAKSDLQNQVNAIDAKAQTLTADLTNSKNDILAQAYAQTALNSRVTTVETTANGTKETVTQLSKTVNDLSGEVSSATQSIKTVEDSIDGVYTTLSKIQVGGANLLNRTRDLYYNSNKTNNTSETYQGFTVASGVSAGTGYVDIYRQEMNTVADKTDYFMTFYAKGMVDGQTIDCYFFNPTSTKRAESSQGTVTTAVDGKTTITLATTWQRYWIKWTQSAGTTAKTVLIGRNSSTNRAYVTMPALFEGNTIRDWAGSLQDSSMEFAEYKQTIDGQLTNLSNSYQTLNGQVNQNTVKIETTANSIREELTSLQSYVDDEGVRWTEYLTVSELKTAELISAERTKVARDYVAKSTYDEDVRGTTLKLNEIKTTADTAKQNLATYQETVDRKLTELTSSTQSLDGKINTASAKVDAVAGQIRTELATVEGKIPTEIGGRNLALNTSSELSTAWTSFNTDGTPINITLGKVLTDGLKTGDTIQVYINVLAELQGSNIVMRLQGDGDVTGWSNGAFPISAWRTYTSAGGYTFSYTAIINDDHIRNSYWTARLRVDGATSGWVRHRRFKVERGKVRTD